MTVAAVDVLAQVAGTGSSTGEAVLFWIIAPIAVLAALGLVISRKAVHGALFIAVVMVSLAVLYIALEAAFLGVVQIVVYTGAIMMLFLFVIMLVGVDASDSRVETIRGHRGAAVLAGLGLGALLVAVAGRALFTAPVGMAAATPEGNVAAIADAIFSRHVWAFEIVSILLITAAVGAIVLTHSEQIFGKASQRELSERRFRSGGNAASQLPSPGIYARHNAVDTPALLPDGSPIEHSIPRVLIARGDVRTTEEDARDIERVAGEIGGQPGQREQPGQPGQPGQQDGSERGPR